MNTNSNSYTIIYASIMVVIVAFLLAFVSSSLKEKQYQNVEQDTKKQILAALNVYDVKDVNAEYDKYVKEDDLMQADGISGGTITSKGVDAMIKDCLSMYNSFLTNK